MADATNIELLRDYSEHGSEKAFATLVERHINLVYSAALRHVSNQAHAQEIAQAVFVILARKAASLRPNTVLEAWLYETTRLTSLSFLRGEWRRQRREQEAYMQSTLQKPDDTAVWNQLAPLLDDAMARLAKKDREALVLRFFKGNNLREVATAMNISEVAAQSRVHRAIEKLRHYFSKNGAHSTTAIIAGEISGNSVHAAPAGLAKSISVIAATKGAAVGGSTLTLVKATLIAMKTKTIITTVATTVILASITTWLASFHFRHPKAAPDFAAAGITFPIQLPNAIFQRGSRKDPLFEIDLDSDTLRTSNSAPAIHIKGPLPPPPDLPLHFSDADIQKGGESSLTAIAITNGSPLMGQHIRITGWLKSDRVRDRAGGYLAIWSKEHGFSRVDSMDDRDDRPILQGTMDWQQIEFVIDIPEEPCVMYVGPDLYGPGELWGDDFQITLASADTKITDDRHWRHTSAEPNTYSESTDFQITRDGRPSVCLAYTGTGVMTQTGTWEWWGQKIRGPDVDKYIGHTVQWSGWVKTENVSRRLQPSIRPWKFEPSAGKSSIVAKDRLAGGNNSLTGTRDWTEFSVTCVIPHEAQHIDTAFILYGSGKVWIDMDSLKFKIIK